MVKEKFDWSLPTVDEMLAYSDRVGIWRAFQQPLIDAKDSFERMKVYRGFYEIYGKYIIENKGWGDIYVLDDIPMRYMTPIEAHFFMLTRSLGRCQLYPQYPVGKYYVDFGNPYHKIAVECDGKQWHDAEKDRLRDIELDKLGWTVFRLSGSDIVKNEEEYLEEFYQEVDDIVRQTRNNYEKTLAWEMAGKINKSPTLLIRMLRYTYFENNYWSRWYKVFLRQQFQFNLSI